MKVEEFSFYPKNKEKMYQQKQKKLNNLKIRSPEKFPTDFFMLKRHQSHQSHKKQTSFLPQHNQTQNTKNPQGKKMLTNNSLPLQLLRKLKNKEQNQLKSSKSFEHIGPKQQLKKRKSIPKILIMNKKYFPFYNFK